MSTMKVTRENTHKQNLINDIFSKIGLPSSYISSIVDDIITILIIFSYQLIDQHFSTNQRQLLWILTRVLTMFAYSFCFGFLAGFDFADALRIRAHLVVPRKQPSAESEEDWKACGVQNDKEEPSRPPLVCINWHGIQCRRKVLQVLIMFWHST